MLDSNFYSVLYYNAVIWLTPSLNSENVNITEYAMIYNFMRWPIINVSTEWGYVMQNVNIICCLKWLTVFYLNKLLDNYLEEEQ